MDTNARRRPLSATSQTPSTRQLIRDLNTQDLLMYLLPARLHPRCCSADGRSISEQPKNLRFLKARRRPVQSYQQDSLGTEPALRLLMVGPRVTFSISSASGQGRPRRRRSPPSLYLDVQSAGPGKSQAVPAVRVVGCMRPSVADTSATGLAQHSYATFDRSR